MKAAKHGCKHRWETKEIISVQKCLTEWKDKLKVEEEQLGNTWKTAMYPEIC